MTDRKESMRRGTVPAVIAATLFAVAFLLANIPGNPVIFDPSFQLDGNYGFCIGIEYGLEEMVHGWPLTYLRHDGHYPPIGDGSSAWEFGGNAHFTPAALGANVVLLAVGTFVVGWLVRRRIQNEGWRFGISHMLLAILCISVIMAYTSSRYRLHQAQITLLERGHPGYVPWQPFGPYWLRCITGPRYWDWGDYLVAAVIKHSDEIAELPGKSAIKVLRIKTVKCDAMPSLDDFHNLVAIDMAVHYDYSNFNGEGESEFWRCLRIISKCQSLQAINLHNTGVTDQGLQELVGMPNLTCLELSRTEVTDDGLVHLASIKSLEMLGLWGTRVTNTGVEKLRAALPNCEIQWDEPPHGVKRLRTNR